MQVTETLSQGLKREFKVVLPATELEQRLTSELATLKDRVRINGFRPGKVPVQHLRRLYGRSVMADVRSEEHTSELQSRQYLVCRLLLEKKNSRKRPQSSRWDRT